MTNSIFMIRNGDGIRTMNDYYRQALHGAYMSIVHEIELYSDDDYPSFVPTAAQRCEALFEELYGQVLDAFEPSMPDPIAALSRQSAALMSCNPARGLELGQQVGDWQRCARQTAHAQLRAALLQIEKVA